MRLNLRKGLLTGFLFSIITVPAFGADRAANSCNTVDINAAVSSAATGDRIIVPAGSCTWSATVTVPNTKRLDFVGAGQGITIITLDNGIYFELGASNSSVSGFTFQSTLGTASMIHAAGSAGSGRIHHNSFTSTTNRACIEFVGSGTAHPVYLVDHINADGCRIRLQGTNQGNGKPFWQTPLALPNFTQCIYVEDSVILKTIGGNLAESDYGGCMVLRFNTVGGTSVDVHGTGAGDMSPLQSDEHPPGRVLEFYNNNCVNPGSPTLFPCVWMRAGTGFVFNNSIKDTYGAKILFDIQGRTPSVGCGNNVNSSCVTGSVLSDGNLGSGTTYPAAGWPAFAQPGFGGFVNNYTLFQNPGLVPMPIPLFNNRICAKPPCSLSAPQVNPSFQGSAQNWIADGHEYQNERASFDGTIGTGVGPIANRPTACTAGVYYWATDEGEWNSLNPGPDGRLYKCTTPNTWTLHYTPLNYPHFLATGATPTPALTTVSPNTGAPGQTLTTVTLIGQNTHFVNGTTTASFGAGITVNSVSVSNSTSAMANITIAAVAAVGQRTVTVTTGGEIVSLANGFNVTTGGDTIPPTVAITNPTAGTSVSDLVTIVAAASDNVGVVGVQFRLDGSTDIGAEDTSVPYSTVWDTHNAMNGNHTVRAIARDAAGNVSTSEISLTVFNTTATFTIPTNGGNSFVTTDPDASQISVSHGLIQQTQLSANTAFFPLGADTSALSAVAIISFRKDGVIVSEAGVGAGAPMINGRLFAEINGGVNTGIALSNPNEQDAVVSFYFTNSSGVDSSTGSLTLKAKQQVAAFLPQAPFNGPANLIGTFTFSSSISIGAIGLRGFTNERGDFLISTLPVAALNSVQNSNVLPHFADGGGWTTQIILTNVSDALQSGTVQFFGQGTTGQDGPLLNMNVNGVDGTTFNYSIAPHAVARLATTGVQVSTRVGSVRLTSTTPLSPTSSVSLPSAAAILSFRNSGITVTEASVIAQPSASNFRMYVESSGVNGQPGAIKSGLAIANSNATPVTVSIEIIRLDGSSAGVPNASVSLPASGQIASFIDEVFQGLPANFQGIAKLTASSNISLTALRIRYNTRGEFLMTTTPPLDDGTTPSTTLLVPQIVSGQGFATQIVVFGRAGSGSIFLYGQDGVLRPATALTPQK